VKHVGLEGRGKYNLITAWYELPLMHLKKDSCLRLFCLRGQSCLLSHPGFVFGFLFSLLPFLVLKQVPLPDINLPRFVTILHGITTVSQLSIVEKYYAAKHSCIRRRFWRHDQNIDTVRPRAQSVKSASSILIFSGAVNLVCKAYRRHDSALPAPLSHSLPPLERERQVHLAWWCPVEVDADSLNSYLGPSPDLPEEQSQQA